MCYCETTALKLSSHDHLMIGFYSGANVDTEVKLIRGFGFIYYLE